jgi:hypothetical protein
VGHAYMQVKDNVNALKYISTGLEMARHLNFLEGIKDGEINLSAVYEEMGDAKNALVHYKKFIGVRDSLFNEENTKKQVRLEMQFDFDKKEATTRLEQEKKEAISIAEAKKQKYIIWAVSCFLFLVGCFAVFVYRSFLEKKKVNLEIVKQKNIIEDKQKEILDSIQYARKIQQALITSETYIHKNLTRLNEKIS